MKNLVVFNFEALVNPENAKNNPKATIRDITDQFEYELFKFVMEEGRNESKTQA